MEEMKNQGIDVLAFGAHADDVEIGMGGSLAKWSKENKELVICDLTEAELSSNGDTNTRKKESLHAASALGIKDRVNLGLPDRGLLLSEDGIREVARIIREFRPKVIFAPRPQDRHPDHGNCSQIVTEAMFSAGIRKYSVGDEIKAHKPTALYHYMINGFTMPTFIIDISQYMDQKIQALQAYQSQFFKLEEGVQTPLTEGYIESVMARERIFGKEAGVQYAEGFMAIKPLLLQHDIFGEKS